MPERAEERLVAGRLLLGARIRGLRTDMGLTLPEFADRVGMTKSQLSDFERGRRLPTPPTLDIVAAGFDLTAADLLDGIYPWGSRQPPIHKPTPPPDPRYRRNPPPT